MKKLNCGLFVLLLAAASAGLAQSQDQPSLGDLAKHQHGDKKVVKVFTNEDVATSSPSTPASQSSPAAATPSVSAASSSSGSDAKTDNKKEAATKDTPKTKDTPQVAELKQKISSYKEQQEGWKKSVKRYEDLLANETSDFRRQMYQDALQGDRQNVQFFQDKIDQAQADLAKADKDSSSNH
jgi:hypothetical protein